MSKKDVFEEYLDQIAEANKVTTVEKVEAKEVEDIVSLISPYSMPEQTLLIIKVLVAKGVVSLKDFKRVLGE